MYQLVTVNAESPSSISSPNNEPELFGRQLFDELDIPCPICKARVNEFCNFSEIPGPEGEMVHSYRWIETLRGN